VDYYGHAGCTGNVVSNMPVTWSTLPQCTPYTVGWGQAAGAKFAVGSCTSATVSGVGWCTTTCGACTGFATITPGVCYWAGLGTYHFKIRDLNCGGAGTTSNAKKSAIGTTICFASASLTAAIAQTEL
jgi:hypothetical protein